MEAVGSRQADFAVGNASTAAHQIQLPRFKNLYRTHAVAVHLRAMRLVVDTGVHAKGWSREQAQAFALRPIRLQDTLNRILLGAAATPVRAA